MDNRKIEVFLQVADCGNLSRAAERLGYTQSGITHMMNSLEADMGFPLLLRSNKGVTLTQEGTRLLPIMREMRKWDELLDQERALIQGIEIGNICIGSFSSISVHWMPQVIARFQKQHPNIHVEMLEGSTRELEQWLHEGRVDICFFSLFSERNFEGVEIMEDPFYAVLPKGHPLSAMEKIPLAVLAKEPIIMYSTPQGLDQDLQHVLGRVKGGWNFRYSSNFDYAVIRMVEQDLGVTVMPRLILQDHDRNVDVRPLDPPVYRRLGIAVRSLKDMSPAMKRFIECAKSVLLNEKQEPPTDQRPKGA